MKLVANLSASAALAWGTEILSGKGPCLPPIFRWPG